MLTRDPFVAVLEKRAAEAEETSIPHNDSERESLQEFHRIQEDSREFLHSIFTNAPAAQSQQTAEAKKIWSGTDGTKVSGNPLMKVAMREFFLEGLEGTSFLKTASPFQKELAFSSFCDELEKIAGPFGGGSLPGSNQAMALAARNKMRATIPPKVHDLSGQAKAMGMGPKPLMGSGTTLNK